MAKDKIIRRGKGSKPRHGYARTPTHRSWAMMLNRCRNENGHDFHYYGARGITVCERWRSFPNFLADMGERPDGTSIERMDNSKGYDKNNCEWVAHVRQVRNRRNTLLLTHNGETKPLAQWCEELGVNYELAKKRIHREGYTSDRILSPEYLEPAPRRVPYKPRFNLLRDKITGRFLKTADTKI